MASITQTGPTSWRVLVRKAGRPTVCRTFRTEKDALAFKRIAERAAAAGHPVDRGTTVRACIEAFRALREARRPISSASTEHYMLRHLDDGLGALLVGRLTPQRIAEFCAERAGDGAGPTTVGMEISKLATVLRHASLWLHTVLPDVVGAARPLLEYQGLIGPGKARERRPSADELTALFERLDPTMQDVVRFAIATAMRRGEIIRLLWSDVDAERRLVLVRDRKHPRAKAGNHQLVPLIADAGFDAWAILQRQPRTDDRIFPLTGERISDAFLAACRAAGIDNLHFHDLRHEATSRLFEAGMAIEQVAMVTGHADWAHLRRYTNLKPESLTADRRGIRPDTRQRRDNLPSARRRRGTSAS